MSNVGIKCTKIRTKVQNIKHKFRTKSKIDLGMQQRPNYKFNVTRDQVRFKELRKRGSNRKLNITKYTLIIVAL